jgi:hypothetical protein
MSDHGNGKMENGKDILETVPPHRVFLRLANRPLQQGRRERHDQDKKVKGVLNTPLASQVPVGLRPNPKRE